MAKALAAVFVAFLVAVVAAKGAYLRSSDTGDRAPNYAWVQNRMEFVAWNSEQWTAWIHGNDFEQAPQNTRKWHRHRNASVAFVGWDGVSWQAKIDGNEFMLARHGDWHADVERSPAIRYRDWAGNKQIRTVAQLRR